MSRPGAYTFEKCSKRHCTKQLRIGVRSVSLKRCRLLTVCQPQSLTKRIGYVLFARARDRAIFANDETLSDTASGRNLRFPEINVRLNNVIR